MLCYFVEYIYVLSLRMKISLFESYVQKELTYTYFALVNGLHHIHFIIPAELAIGFIFLEIKTTYLSFFCVNIQEFRIKR